MFNEKKLGLTILNSYQVKCLSNGKVQMVKKFLDEMVKFSSLWPGKTRVIVEQDPKQSDLIETITINQRELPFDLQIVSCKDLNPTVFLKETSIAYSSISHRHNEISKFYKAADVPCIYISEYSLLSRKRMISVNTKNPLLRLRRNFWEDNEEKKRTKAIKLASGIHCNGTPTYEEYRCINSNSLLYFDNRVPDNLLAKPEEVEERNKYLCENNEPIRLCFSGRLIAIKGADRLIDVAQELKQLQVKFEMYICGNGDLKDIMQSRITASGLQDSVKMMGLLSFHTQLIPFIKKNVDLFVCCHIQSDPSCTYLETMSCGVPIIGYANEAFLGIVEHSGAGWPIDMDRPKLLAHKIAELSKNRQAIKDMSFKALKFAKDCTFDRIYENRINHIKETYFNIKFN